MPYTRSSDLVQTGIKKVLLTGLQLMPSEKIRFDLELKVDDGEDFIVEIGVYDELGNGFEVEMGLRLDISDAKPPDIPWNVIAEVVWSELREDALPRILSHACAPITKLELHYLEDWDSLEERIQLPEQSILFTVTIGSYVDQIKVGIDDMLCRFFRPIEA